MGVYKRGGKWWIDFQRGKKRIRLAAQGAETKEQALDFLALKRKEAIEDRIYGPKPEADTTSFSDFADHFLATDSPDKKSKERDKGILDILKDTWAGKALSEITTEDIEKYKALRAVTAKRNAWTVNKEIGVIKRLFSCAVKWGRIPVSPASKDRVKWLRTPAGRVRFLEPGEMAELMKWLPDWLSPIVRFALHTGARRSEIFNLEWRDVDLRLGLLTFRDSKNGENGVVEMNQTARALLEFRQPEGPKVGPVFEPVTWGKLKGAWRRACKKAKITDFHFHDLRHQAATDLLTRGATLNDVRDFLRHKSMNMTLRYAHLVRARRQRTAALLDSPLPAPESGTKPPQSETTGPASPDASTTH